MRPLLFTFAFVGFTVVAIASYAKQPFVSSSPDYEILKIEEGQCISVDGVLKNVLEHNPGTELVEDIGGERLDLFRKFYITYFRSEIDSTIERLLVFDHEDRGTVWLWGLRVEDDHYCVVTDDFISADLWALWITGAKVGPPVREYPV